ncbi:MAG: hypothetical protein IJ049_03525 [Oscillospiraceae bacterium]|nr:hypothetical protein [Oscillospiraceae bacterium]
MYEILTDFLPKLQDTPYGEWIVDHKNDGSPEHPKQFPFVAYDRVVIDFHHAVYRFIEQHQELELTRYSEILEQANIEWETQSMRNADVTNLDGQTVMALIVGVICADCFCEGTLLKFFQDGSIARWLYRLRELDQNERSEQKTISPEGFVSLHENDSYQALLDLRDALMEEIRRFEKRESPEGALRISQSPEVMYQCNLQYVARLCDYIAARYHREFENGEDEHWLFVIRDYLKSKGLTYNTSLSDEIERRKEGKEYTIKDHIRGMVYSMLTNQTKWHRVEPHLHEIDRLFFDYDPEMILKTEPAYFREGLFRIKCGNVSTKAQTEALAYNVRNFRKIEKEYVSIDAFITSDRADIIVQKLSKKSSPYKLKMLGEALVWEYLRNVGIDGAKPDTHLRRFLGANRMGSGENAPATVDEVNRQVTELSEETGLSKVEIDNLIWSFCADGFGEVCTASPHCSLCPIRKYCKTSKPQGNTVIIQD